MTHPLDVPGLLLKIKGHGFTDAEIAEIVGVNSKTIISKWRLGVVPYPRNMERLILLADVVAEVNRSIGARGNSSEVKLFMSTPHPRLDELSPGEFLLRKGPAAREDIILVAKSYREARALVSTDYALLHVRLDMEILQRFEIDRFDLGYIINRDIRRIDEMVNENGKKSRPSQLEARQFRQAAAAAIFISEHRSHKFVRKLMFEPGVNYRNKWMAEMNTKPSIVDIIRSQIEGDARSQKCAANDLTQSLNRFKK